MAVNCKVTCEEVWGKENLDAFAYMATGVIKGTNNPMAFLCIKFKGDQQNLQVPFAKNGENILSKTGGLKVICRQAQDMGVGTRIIGILFYNQPALDEFWGSVQALSKVGLMDDEVTMLAASKKPPE